MEFTETRVVSNTWARGKVKNYILKQAATIQFYYEVRIY
jgi:hypothetical protein